MRVPPPARRQMAWLRFHILTGRLRPGEPCRRIGRHHRAALRHKCGRNFEREIVLDQDARAVRSDEEQIGAFA